VRQVAAATLDGWGTAVTDTTAHRSPALGGHTSLNGSPGFRVASGAAAVSTGLLAGSLFYGWANVVPAFAALPLDVHLAFRTELMNHNGVVMQALMAASLGAAVWLAVVAGRTRARRWALIAAGLTMATFFVTRLGNVPINGEIRAWAAGEVPDDYLDRLVVWGVFNDIRVSTAVAAFVVIIIALGQAGRALRSTKFTTNGSATDTVHE
jgi:uncharacterized membrane protein